MSNRDILNGYNFILASQSPRRRELLGGLDIKFTIAQKYDVDETAPDDLKCEDVAEYLSLKKSEEYPYQLSDSDILITSDTIVVVEDMLFGKPANKNDAIYMLSTLSGKTHKVITAVTLKSTKLSHTFKQITEVKFKELEREDILYYIDNYSPYDKAGAYAIQEWIGYTAIEHINGSFYNVMGLPVCKLNNELINFITK